MRALVPVSVRTQEQRGTLGNQLAVMRGPLPVYIDDAVARLQFVREAMDGLKESKQAVGAATLAQVNNLAPPTVLAQASRLNFSTRLFNLIVTNVPGPQLPLYVLGRELEDLFPVAFLPENHALAIAIMSYNGSLDYGLLGDYDALADIDVVAEGLDESLAELLAAARGGRGTRRPRGVARRGSRGRAQRPSGAAAPAGNGSESASDGSGGASAPDGDGREPAPSLITGAAASRPKQGPAAAMRAKRSGRRGAAPRDPAAGSEG
jgi:hypothetical protein